MCNQNWKSKTILLTSSCVVLLGTTIAFTSPFVLRTPMTTTSPSSATFFTNTLKLDRHARSISSATTSSFPFRSSSSDIKGSIRGGGTLGTTTTTTMHTTDENLTEEEKFTKLPRHDDNEDINRMLSKAQTAIEKLYKDSIEIQSSKTIEEKNGDDMDTEQDPTETEKVYSNSYVDLGKVDTVGFDYDYTLVTYKDELLELIYDMTLKRLVQDYSYPPEMLEAGMSFDPSFSVRGLAVDRETGWICHLSYTHKVSVAYEGRKKVSRERLITEYRGKRSLKPDERKKRLKPLNDLFSMAECCLIADVVGFFTENNIPFCPKNAVVDCQDAIGRTHISGDFHRLVAKEPEKYFEPRPHLNEMLQNLKSSGKRLIFVSNSPFWYVDAGMKYVIGDKWREMWDAVIVSAGKPRFYKDNERPFRQVDQETGLLQFKKVSALVHSFNFDAIRFFL